MQTLHMNDSLPTLYIPYPRCDHCGEDVVIDDGGASCEGCRVSWDRIGEDVVSTPDTYAHNDAATPCAAVEGNQDQPHDDRRGNHYVPGPPQPCILPSGHTGRHLCPYDVEVTCTAEIEGV